MDLLKLLVSNLLFQINNLLQNEQFYHTIYTMEIFQHIKVLK
nr:MAG TPA: hypothetical protein [Caudoviricetes sp.]